MGGGGGGICSRKVGQPGYLVSERSPPPIGVFFFPFLFCFSVSFRFICCFYLKRASCVLDLLN